LLHEVIFVADKSYSLLRWSSFETFVKSALRHGCIWSCFLHWICCASQWYLHL